MEEITSQFFVAGCLFLPNSCSVDYYRRDVPIPSRLNKPIIYSIRCGSSEEFYIRPLNSCIDDLDAMKVIYDALVFSEDSPELPNDVSKLAESIQCYNAEPYPEYPGFVRLRQLGEMNYIWKCKKYAFSPTTTPNAYTNLNWDSYSSCLDYFIGDKFSTLSRSVTGPAIKCQEDPKDMTRDDVHSLWCPQWPRQAQLWPKRNREYGWPTIDAITEVVHNGCHVVSVQHRACKNDALMWRYSFSVAEVILLRRWTPVQQIVY